MPHRLSNADAPLLPKGGHEIVPQRNHLVGEQYILKTPKNLEDHSRGYSDSNLRPSGS